MKNSYVVLEQEVGKRSDLFLAEFLPPLISKEYRELLTRSQIVKIVSDIAEVNGEPLRKGYKLKLGDSITVDTSKLEEILSQTINQKSTLEGSEGDLEIVEETPNYIVVKKEKGVVVHPGEGNWSGTLANIVKGYLEKKGEYDERVDRGGIVHRLDKGVSGLLIVAKNLKTQQYLKEQFENRQVIKVYKAKVEPFASAVVELPLLHSQKDSIELLESEKYLVDDSWYKLEGFIGRDNRDRRRMRFSPIKENLGYRYALTYVKRITPDELLIKIETGRMHQIRASLRYLGYGIVGDSLYGKNRSALSDSIELESIYMGLNVSKNLFKFWSI